MNDNLDGNGDDDDDGGNNDGDDDDDDGAYPCCQRFVKLTCKHGAGLRKHNNHEWTV